MSYGKQGEQMKRQGVPSGKSSLKQQRSQEKMRKRISSFSYGGMNESFASRSSIYDEPELKADKGKKAGSCNRRACQAPGAVYWNRGSYAYYCGACARLINGDYRGDLGPEPLCSIDEEALEILADKC
jgi:hypothetical protein